MYCIHKVSALSPRERHVKTEGITRRYDRRKGDREEHYYIFEILSDERKRSPGRMYVVVVRVLA